METEQTTILHLLRPREGESLTEALSERSDVLQRKLQEKFGAEYEISAGKQEPPEDKWDLEIKVRQGIHIGAEVRFSWNRKKAKILSVDVDKSTRIGSYIAMGTLFPAFVIGAYMGVTGIPPLDFLGGTKIGGLIAGLITAVPGLIVMLILRSAVMGKHKAENKALKKEVFDLVKFNFVDNIAQFYLKNERAAPRKE